MVKPTILSIHNLKIRAFFWTFWIFSYSTIDKNAMNFKSEKETNSLNFLISFVRFSVFFFQNAWNFKLFLFSFIHSMVLHVEKLEFTFARYQQYADDERQQPKAFVCRIREFCKGHSQLSFVCFSQFIVVFSSERTFFAIHIRQFDTNYHTGVVYTGTQKVKIKRIKEIKKVS